MTTSGDAEHRLAAVVARLQAIRGELHDSRVDLATVDVDSQTGLGERVHELRCQIAGCSALLARVGRSGTPR